MTSIINISGLSVGMAAAVLIMIWVHTETSFDNYKDKGNIYLLYTSLPTAGWIWETTPLKLAPAIKDGVPEIELTARLCTNNLPVFNVKGNIFYQKQSAYVDEDWFKLFGYQFKEGNASGFDANPFSVIITESEAVKYFGRQNAVGQIIHIDSANYLVRGVLADPTINSSFQYQAFLPISVLLTNPQIRENDEQWGNANYITFIKASYGSNSDKVIGKINSILQKKVKPDDYTPVSILSLKEMHFANFFQFSSFVHGNQNTVYLFSLLGFLLLLIACINYVNLTTAKASVRAKEVSIRKITGANRSHLFFQFIVESLFISILSLFVTLILLKLSLPIFNTLTGRIFTLPANSAVLWIVSGITLLTALLLNSIYPALVLSSFKPLNVFRGRTILKLKDNAFRKGLVVLQFTISVILICSTIVIYNQMNFIQTNDPGYNRSEVVSFALPPSVDRQQRESLMHTMKQELLSESGIESVTTSNQPIVDMGSYCSACADWAGRDTGYNPKIAQLSADADFQKTMQLHMQDGRWFRQGDKADRHGVILNETAVQEFRLRKPILGQSFIFKGDTGLVLGVVKNFTFKSMHEKMGPLVIFNNPSWRSHFMVRVAPKSVANALINIQKVWRTYLPQSPLEYTFLDDSFNNLYKEDQQSSSLMFVFAVIALVISALGLFSLSAFEAEQRTKEIGIRKVLGASVAGIMALISKDFIKLVCIAITVATPIAWTAMHAWIENFAYRIDLSWWIFAVAGLSAIAIALITISFQSVKAALANPIMSLRCD